MTHFFVLKWIVMQFFIWFSSAQQCDQPVTTARFDCYPEPSISQEKCLARNCCWNPTNQLLKTRSINNSLEIGVPLCYYPRDFPSYKMTSNESTAFGQRLTIVKQQSTYMPNE
ncbi:unnamed protein product, partial [Rotaria magnacalcarata]